MDITNAIKTIARQGMEIYLRICTVDAVDETARTVDCTPIDGDAPILGVNLQADQSQDVGVSMVPAVGSDVVVGFISPAVAVVLLTTDITKAICTVGKVSVEIIPDSIHVDANGSTLDMSANGVVYNDGSETTANATKLHDELLKMSARIDTIIQAISTSPVTAGDGGAAYKSAMAAMVGTSEKEDFSQIIDNKIKH